MLNEFDLILYRLHNILEESLYCEDGKLRIKNKLKYDVYNLLCEVDKSFINDLHKKLEYKEE